MFALKIFPAEALQGRVGLFFGMKMGTLRNSAAGGGLEHPRFFYYQKIVKYNHFPAS
jgi:hypothetical protein